MNYKIYIRVKYYLMKFRTKKDNSSKKGYIKD